ncbi:MAG TPA: hypothetical protein VD998_01510, partial [Verrucomicrobiae bacterium]|nr:hypothetical protein [Verrucomicrobiae bacterium]
MKIFLFTAFIFLAGYYFYYFVAGSYKLSPLWLMLSAWAVALGIPQLNLSKLEKSWTQEFWILVAISLVSFALGFFAFNWLWSKYPLWEKF